ncbi:MAG: hypothetical protein KIT68_13325, partial [Phycisphaeraceae bacterium]|nr:hypothetical protein [Phycisphaeraceae bacterium]
AQAAGLARAGKAWEAVPRLLELLATDAADGELWLHLAASYGRLGLATAAREVLGAMPAMAASHPSAALVRTLVAGLADDRVSVDWREATLAANLDVVRNGDGDSAAALAAALPAWRERARAHAVFRSGDGNLVQRAAGQGPLSAWSRWGDERAAAAARTASLAGARGVADVRPVYVRGFESPWLVARLGGALVRHADGSQARLTIVEPDAAAALDGLSLLDLRGVLSRAGTECLIGPGAVERFERLLAQRRETMIAGPVFEDSQAEGVLSAALGRAIDAQSRALEDLRRRIGERYAGRDRAWWGRRYRSALGGGGEPLRVLIPASRYTTFLRHSARDLGAALRRAGCEVRVLTEPDAHSVHSALAAAVCFDGWGPDAVVTINWPRGALGPGVPAEVPGVMYVQDAMPHLFDPALGRSLGGLDFVMGHLHSRFFTGCGYPAARTLQCPVVACAEKFHDGPVDSELLERHRCEIAYVSHQSQPPEALAARLIDECRAGTGGGGAMPAVIEALVPRVRAMADDALRRWHWREIVALAERALREVTGAEPDASETTLVVNSVIKPLADRWLRHGAAMWAAEICARRGWRFRLYGRGWESHRVLGAFACGELEHGEALRASYRAAAVHLHASSGWMLHQRVMECALSGGLPAARVTMEDVMALRGWAEAAVGRRIGERPDLDPGQGREAPIADHWEAMAWAAQAQRLGLEAGPTIYVERDAAHKPWLNWAGSAGMAYEAAWLLGDWSRTCFADAPSLERLVERAVERPDCRRELSEAIAGRVRRGLTYDAVAGRLLRLMRDELSRREGA